MAHSIRISLALSTLIAALPAAAQFTQSGCDTLKASDFQASSLFALSSNLNSPLAPAVPELGEPVAMAFNAVKSGDSVTASDIYLVERKGAVRKYDATARTVKQIGFVLNAETNANRQGDNGLMGIALDPSFATNRWVYLWYIPVRANSNENYRGRLSRFTLGAQDTLQPGTEKVLIDIKLSKAHQWHSGGPMRFDAHGDLWLTIGNNANDLNANATSGSQYSTDSSTSQEWGSSNTASMRGGVIRIHPDNSAKGYSIPSGNFGQHWATYFEGKGNATLAAQYRDTSKVLPEVYVKGTRSNYSITVHPTKRWLGWGEVNYSNTNEEFNLVTTPAFTGFPYFHRNNVATPGGIPGGVAKDTAAPLNLSSLNSGVSQLPPAVASQIWSGSSLTPTTLTNSQTAIGGDIYVYDRNLKSGVKFPPHLHNSMLLMDFLTNVLFVARIDSTTVRFSGTPRQLNRAGDWLGLNASPTNLRAPVQASYGPDGALYILNYGGRYNVTNNPGVVRVAYNGSCKLAPVAVSPVRQLADLSYALRGGVLEIREAGAHEVMLYTLTGEQVFRETGTGSRSYDLRKAGSRGGVAGAYILRVKTAQGTYGRNISLL